jgi:hypothetical protein
MARLILLFAGEILVFFIPIVTIILIRRSAQEVFLEQDLSRWFEFTSCCNPVIEFTNAKISRLFPVIKAMDELTLWAPAAPRAII